MLHSSRLRKSLASSKVIQVFAIEINKQLGIKGDKTPNIPMQVPPLKRKQWHEPSFNTNNPWEDTSTYREPGSNNKEPPLDPDVSILSLDDDSPIKPKFKSINPFIEEDLGLITDKLDNLSIKDNRKPYMSYVLIGLAFLTIFYYFEKVALKITLYSVFLCIVAYIIDKLVSPKSPQLTRQQSMIRSLSLRMNS